ncbi:hypothetical protein N7517_010544 [Penicillium concentricum]|uniref:Mid2 domain-containing protein n=1 Tax=Penicillium concentricum TaxID=293559 RepID=A0A9W9RAD8_9EURO|nr:uncharacterized protein N7517_010544 [Penicillium concentricum]KAJ5355935.1 hypothetical protein N7517_010544 [Penicillium concentricum]
MLPPYALFLIPLANAWTFRTTNATGATEIARGEEEQQCTNSTIGKGKLFTWDPEGSDLCVSIYRDIECVSRAGYSCGIWRKNASEQFLAFDVLLESEINAKHKTSTALISTSTSATSSKSTSTSTSPTSSSSVAAASASATPTESSAASAVNANSDPTSPSLSGGTIAGIVVGVIAAVAIIVAFIVVFMRKKNNKNAAAANQDGGFGPHEVDATESSMGGTTVAEKAGNSIAEKEAESVRRFRPAPGSQVVELVGDEGSAELGSSPISEMDGTSAKRPFNVV